jgi:hypothetical protein
MAPNMADVIGTVQDYGSRTAGCYNDADPLMTPSDISKSPHATVSVKQTARLLGISPDKVREGIRNGTIPGYIYGDRPSYKVYRVLLLQMVGYPEDYEFPD